MDQPISETSADAPPVPRHHPDEPSPEPRARRRWVFPALLAPLVVLIVVVIAWAVDTSSGGTARHVTVAGRDVGKVSEAELASRVDSLAEDFGATQIQIAVADRTYETTAQEIGLIVDEDQTAANVLDVDADTFALLRPFTWVASFLREREAEVEFEVSREQMAAALIELEGDDRTPPTEPTVELVDGQFRVLPGVDGRGLQPDVVALALPRAAEERNDGEPIRVEISRGPLPPLGTQEAAREAAADAEALVDHAIEVRASDEARTIEPEEMRTWVTLVSQPDGSVVVDLDAAVVAAALRQRFADVDGHPVDATVTLRGGTPVIVPDEPGLVCCGDGAATSILEAMRADAPTVELELVEGPAAFTAEDAAAWGIIQPVGGNHAWRDGAPTTAAPGFTTYHAAGGNRVTNIHRMADLVRGAIVPPDGVFSINDHVGRRTTAKGFLPAGAISNGLHVDEVGGGVSQFATTMFNAAYFAGLEIVTSQAHSEYFDRYPYGREATMGFPAPDLAFRNDTPYGILIWTSYTDTSLTVTLYSTPHATAEQTGTSEGRSGNCRVVTTTRTRTYPDGRTAADTFRATYRPGEGQRC